ncbi:MAG: hypothetical protein KGI67_02910, partial [Pseudomonadota bacterium]|nr:hypothetical protein [Pseudomonadota bacterium]
GQQAVVPIQAPPPGSQQAVPAFQQGRPPNSLPPPSQSQRMPVQPGNAAAAPPQYPGAAPAPRREATPEGAVQNAPGPGRVPERQQERAPERAQDHAHEADHAHEKDRPHEREPEHDRER